MRGIPREVLRGVTFHVRPGEAYGLVGESGCGKSTTAYAALRYLPSNGVITAGRILVGGADVTKMSERELRRFRATRGVDGVPGPGLGAEPDAEDRPPGRRGVHDPRARQARGAGSRRSDALRRVRIADPERVMQRYPHQLSGGMQQRVVIAMALACDPKLLVLDEPTTGLDATVEAEVLDLVRALRSETDAAILLIAHNLGVIRSMCDRVGVMYAGKIVEEGDAVEVFEAPKHPYTIGLLQCLPRHGVRKSERALFTIPGTLPQIGTPLPTCVYVDRCALADDLCRTEVPPACVDVGDAGPLRTLACHHVDRLDQMPEPEADEAPNPLGGRDRHRDAATSPRRSASTATTSRRSSASTSASATARRSASSASPDRARARWPRSMLGIYEPDPGQRDLARRRTLLAGKAADRPHRATCAPCRWCSRTRTAR